MKNPRLTIAMMAASLCLLMSAGSLLAQQADEAQVAQSKLRVDLVDGSRIIGTTTHKSLKIDVGFDELTIPLDRIRRVQQGEKAKTVRVELNNGDMLTGKLIAEPLNLTTIFGPVKLTLDQIISLEVVPDSMLGWLPTQRGLVLYYPFDDGDTATNHAADKHHGKSTGVTWLEKGLKDGALEYDGQGRTVIAHHEDLCPQQFTLAAWIYPIGESSQYQVPFAKTIPGSWQQGYGLVRWSGDPKHLYFFVNNYSQASVKAEIPHDKWSHVAGVFDGTTLSMYLNGKLVESKDLKAAGMLGEGNQPVTHTNTDLILGGDGQNYYGWQGRLDEVVLYNRALPPEDIRRLYEIIPRQLGS